jgi:hypothetical protein
VASFPTLAPKEEVIQRDKTEAHNRGCVSLRELGGGAINSPISFSLLFLITFHLLPQVITKNKITEWFDIREICCLEVLDVRNLNESHRIRSSCGQSGPSDSCRGECVFAPSSLSRQPAILDL